MLSINEAKRLVYVALPNDTKGLPGLFLEAGTIQTKRRIVAFDVLWANPGPGSVHVDFYYVDRQTAALWRGISCKPVVNPEVEQLQRRLQKRLGVTTRQRQQAVKSSLCLDSSF